MEINMTKTNNAAELVTEAIQAYLDYYDLECKQKFRKLTFREQAEQSIAALKLIVYGSAVAGSTLDRLITAR